MIEPHAVRRLSSLPAISILVLLTGCATVPDLGPPPAPRPADQLATATSFAADAGAFPADGWWSGFGDPQLGALIDEGLAGSPSLAAATARLASAAAQLRQAEAATLPGLSVDGSAGGIRQSQNQGFPPGLIPGTLRSTGRLAANFGFDLDLWGRNRAALRAATSDATAAAVDREQARLMLTTGIAASYARLGALFAERDVAAEALALAERAAALTTQRVEAGLDHAGAGSTAAARSAEARGALRAVDQQIALTRNALAALLGAGPDRGLAIAPPRLDARPALLLPPSLPLDLMGRRPDVVSARLRAEAAAARIEVARADFYPSVNLSAVVGLQSIGLGDLLRGGSLFANLGPALHLPIFDGGAIAARYRNARAGFDLAVADYDQRLVEAFRDVADAVSAKRATIDRLALARDQQAAALNARRVAELRYRQGLSSQLQLIAADEATLAARRAVSALENQSVLDDIALIRALGGGYRAAPAANAEVQP